MTKLNLYYQMLDQRQILILMSAKLNASSIFNEFSFDS